MGTKKWSNSNKATILRRSTRIKYRNLAQSTLEKRAQIVDPMNKQYLQTLEEQQEIYKEVCHPNEAFLDIEQARTMSNILKEQTRSLANEQFTITPQDYISAICRDFGQSNNAQHSDSEQNDDDNDDEPKQVNWAQIGTHFASYFLTVPPIQFMNGPLQQCEATEPIKKKTKIVRKKTKFTSDAPQIQPKKVVKQKKSDKTETKSRVTHLKKVFRKKCNGRMESIRSSFLLIPLRTARQSRIYSI